jgi:hypothetical protein
MQLTVLDLLLCDKPDRFEGFFEDTFGVELYLFCCDCYTLHVMIFQYKETILLQ